MTINFSRVHFEEQTDQLRRKERMILRVNENGSKQYESSRVLYMEVVPNMEGPSLMGNRVDDTSTI